MWDHVEIALLKKREAMLAEEAAFEKRLAYLVEYAELLWWFRENGGDPAVGAEEARRAWLQGLVKNRW